MATILPQIELTGGPPLTPDQVLDHALNDYRLKVANEASKSVVSASPDLDAPMLSEILMEVMGRHLNPFRLLAGAAFRHALVGTRERNGVYIENTDAAKIGDEAAVNLGSYYASTSANAVMDGYHRMVNAGLPPKEAARRAVKAFGLTKSQMNALIALQPDQGVKSSQPGALSHKADGFIERAIKQRLRVVVENSMRQVDHDAVQSGWEEMVRTGALPDTALKVWFTAEDEKVCPICGPMDGKMVPVMDTWRLPDGNKVKTPGVHVNCLPASAVVAADAGHTAMKRWYEGPMVEVRTQAGHIFSATPHHPVLTERGWTPIGHLHEGAHLVTDVSGEWLPGGNPDVDRNQSSIADRYEALLMNTGMLPVSMEVAPQDFYGDATSGEVHIVFGDGELRGETQRQERRIKGQFVRTAMGSTLLSRAGSLTQFSIRSLSSAYSGMRGSGAGRTLIGGLGSGKESVLFTDGSDIDPRSNQTARDDGATHRVLLSERLDALSGLVAFDEVVEVRAYPFSGHVYDLTTNCGWFVANGVVTHNCRCAMQLLHVAQVSKAWEEKQHPRDARGEFRTKFKEVPTLKLDVSHIEANAPEVAQMKTTAFGAPQSFTATSFKPLTMQVTEAKFAHGVEPTSFTARPQMVVGGKTYTLRSLSLKQRLKTVHPDVIAQEQVQMPVMRSALSPVTPMGRNMIAFATAHDLNTDLNDSTGHAHITRYIRFVDRNDPHLVNAAINAKMEEADEYFREHEQDLEPSFTDLENASDPNLRNLATELRTNLMANTKIHPHGSLTVSVSPEDASNAWRDVLTERPGEYEVQVYDKNQNVVAAAKVPSHVITALSNVDPQADFMPQVIVAPNGTWDSENSNGYGETEMVSPVSTELNVSGPFTWSKNRGNVYITPDVTAYQRATEPDER